MKTYLDCVPCIINQAINLSKELTSNASKQEAVLRETLKILSQTSYSKSPPHIAKGVHRAIRRILKNKDPYKKVKQKYNKKALKLYPSLKRKVRSSKDRFTQAVKLAIAGNVIDFASNHKFELNETIKETLNKKLAINDIPILKKELKSASTILYLGDNAGETVFDRILIEELPKKKIYYAVRGGPVINDATIEDAYYAGLDKMTQIISNGSDAPGTILEDCSKKFKQVFDKVDLIMAKGQGNYETLDKVKNKRIYFLFMVKCPIIAYDAGCSVGDNVVMKARN